MTEELFGVHGNRPGSKGEREKGKREGGKVGGRGKGWEGERIPVVKITSSTSGAEAIY